MTFLPAPLPRGTRARPWEEVDLVALDFEATGLDFARDVIVSFGVVPVRGGRVVLADAQHQLVDPDVPPSAISQKIHELRPQDLAGSPRLDEARIALRDAIRGLIEADDDASIPASDAEVMDRIGLAAGLHPHFHSAHAPTLEPKGQGVAAAFGAIVAIAFVGEFDGSFAHLKLCADETCRAVFYDRSKNHSGRWCSMSTCGNRNKVRAWRERQRVED
jgi:predicted RNA-binding Zn ribbon-like protein